MADDPLKYFRIEARELAQGLGRGTLELEKGASKDAVRGLLRLAHTLKGAARVVRQPEIAEQAHAIEDTLAPFRESGGPVPRGAIDQLLASLDAISARLGALQEKPAAAPAVEAPRGAPEGRFETVRLELRDMDLLFESAGESAARLAALTSRLDGLEAAWERLQGTMAAALRRDEAAGGIARALRAPLEDAREAVERARRGAVEEAAASTAELRGLREQVDRMRLVPAGALFDALERAARDAARSLGKSVEFRSAGGDVRFEANVLAGLQDILLHMVRNAVAHGIEAPAARSAAGKRAEGLVEVRVVRRGHRAVVSCTDDGRGLDTEGIKQAAVRRGVVDAGQAAGMGPEEVVAMIMKGGVTTTERPDGTSGRGVGLDVVAAAAARLKGVVRVRTEPRRGTTFEAEVPLSLSALRALLVEAGGRSVALPLDSVREVVRLAPGNRIEGGSADLAVRPLAGLLGPESRVTADCRAAVLIDAGAGTIALGVDRINGTESVVTRLVPPWSGAPPWIAGASIPEAGDPILLLEPSALPQAPGAAAAAAPPEKPLPLLVVDDSLTTRRLQQSILESAGYEVHLATSGEEGLEMARTRRYGMFLVDVEMPGMTGFDFVRMTRADKDLARVPAMLVTSRGSAEDRRRGEEAGAVAYMVKSDFDQVLLLRLIARLLAGRQP
jgi:two-component system, chemotaxis family, sensor kinase CheA